MKTRFEGFVHQQIATPAGLMMVSSLQSSLLAGHGLLVRCCRLIQKDSNIAQFCWWSLKNVEVQLLRNVAKFILKYSE